MDQLDTLIERFAAGSISRRGLVKGAAALGVSGAALQALRAKQHRASRSRPRTRCAGSRRAARSTSSTTMPTGLPSRWATSATSRRPWSRRPIEATAGTKAVADGQADVAYPSPGVFSLMIEQGSPLISVFEMGAYDVFDFAFQKGQAPASVKDLEGKTVALGSAGWSGHLSTRRSLRPVAIHTKVNYVDAGPQWGQTLAQGQADAALSWAGLRAQWAAIGLDFDYILGKDWSKFPANSLRIRRSDFEDAALADIYGRYFRGWAMGLEFGYHNPAPRPRSRWRAASPALNEVFEDKQIAVESMWQLAEVFRGDWASARAGAGIRRGLGPLPQDHLRDRPAHQGPDGRRRV